MINNKSVGDFELKNTSVEADNNYAYTIYFKTESELIKLVDIVPCYSINVRPTAITSRIIGAAGTNLQDCITTWERYANFIELVDTAYDELNNVAIEVLR